MDQQVITLIYFGYFEKDLLSKIAVAVAQEYQCMVRTREAHLDLSEFYDPARRQYNGDMLLRKVDNLFDSGTLKNLGLFNVDLFIPILTFIFGQAHLGGRSGIASSYRLHNERYGLAKDPDLLAERLIKEVIHELGHTFGLIHCPVPSCVMQSSTYVEHIDQKESHLCMGCRKLILRNSCPGSVSL